MGIDEVQSRIADIQARLAAGHGAPGVAAGSVNLARLAALSGLSTSVSAKTGAAFADTLSTATGSADTSTSGGDVVTEAKKYLGVPYEWGGEDSGGIDCSGLVQSVYEKFGIDMPRVSRDQAKEGVEVKGGVKNAQPGDLIFYGSPVNHVGIYVGDGKMINAPRPGKDVRIEPVYGTPVSVRRVLPSAPTGVSAATGVEAATLATTPGTSLGTPYAALFERAGAKYDVPPALLAAVAKTESGYRADATSPAGARGLMQIMPGTAKGLGINPFDPAQAVDGAARLLKRHLKEFKSVDLALAAYNAGQGAVRKYGGIPPYAETRAYVRKVESAMSTISQGAA